MNNKYTPGQDCNCHAYSESECGCDADWTPNEVYELREKLAAERALADRLREIFPKILNALDNGSGCTPEVSLEFLQGIPKEVELVVKHLKYENSYSEKERIDIAKELESEKKMHAETQNKLDGALEQIIHLQPKMTNEQINVAIAEACGWTDIPIAKHPLTGELIYGQTFLPDYCNDLNPMHEAEMVLTEIQCAFYRQNLHEIITDIPASRYVWHATARQRAEAFLRTLGKWEGGPQ